MTKLDRPGNKILERLPEQDFKRIAGLMEKVCPEVGMIVAFPDKEPKWVHFPISGVLSSMVVLEDGSTVEASTIGNEGMDGLYLLADPLANPYRINVQVQGDMFRMSAAAFKRALHESHALSQLLLRYAMVLIQRGAQNGACIQHHTIEERMCRWLPSAETWPRRTPWYCRQPSSRFPDGAVCRCDPSRFRSCGSDSSGRRPSYPNSPFREVGTSPAPGPAVFSPPEPTHAPACHRPRRSRR
jgi:hypothetical protein